MRYHWEIIVNGESIASCRDSSDCLPLMRQLRESNQFPRAFGIKARKIYH